MIALASKECSAMDADSFGRAVRSSRPVLAAVRPEQLDDSTPCASWKVRDLINHMVQAPRFCRHGGEYP